MRSEVPVAALIPDVTFDWSDHVHRVHNQLLEIGAVDVRLDVADRPIEIAGNQVEHFLSHGRESTDAQVAGDYHYGDLNTGKEVDEIAVDAAQFFVASVQLFVQGVELFVARLELLLGRVQLLVRALELLVAREDLFVRGLQLLVGRLELLND